MRKILIWLIISFYTYSLFNQQLSGITTSSAGSSLIHLVYLFDIFLCRFFFSIKILNVKLFFYHVYTPSQPSLSSRYQIQYFKTHVCLTLRRYLIWLNIVVSFFFLRIYTHQGMRYNNKITRC